MGHLTALAPEQSRLQRQPLKFAESHTSVFGGTCLRSFIYNLCSPLIKTFHADHGSSVEEQSVPLPAQKRTVAYAARK